MINKIKKLKEETLKEKSLLKKLDTNGEFSLRDYIKEYQLKKSGLI